MKEEEEYDHRNITKIILTLMVSITILFVVILSSMGSNAEQTNETRCLIIVSGYNGYSGHELGKASAFYDHINDTLSEDDIRYLTIHTDPESDGQATISNVENAFEWLKENSLPENNVIIYISDHAKRSFNETHFCFNDGNVSTDTINSWMNQIQCLSITVVLNGERSGLGGLDLQGPSRDVICSMRSYQTFDPDLFNITRSLEDPLADSNNDGVVDFIEAFWMEDFLLTGTGQDPVLYK